MEPASILKAIKRCLPNEPGPPVSLHQPSFSGKEWEYVKECLDSGWVSSVGKYVDEFEERLQVTTGAKYAVAVMNGTAALHLCLQLCGVERDDEVLAPALAFVAVANAISANSLRQGMAEPSDSSLGIFEHHVAHVCATIGDTRSATSSIF